MTGTLPFGHELHEGDKLSATVYYAGPGCKVMQANFIGYHIAGSAWYQHFCAPTCPSQVSTVFLNRGTALSMPAGTIELLPDVGHYPTSPDAGVDGFILCQVRLVMNDGVFAGPSFERTFGEPC